MNLFSRGPEPVQFFPAGIIIEWNVAYYRMGAPAADRDTMEAITLKNGMQLPRLGMGTWLMGEKKEAEAREISALRTGLDAGIRLIDTAEMYGEGLAERLVGKAIRGYDRDLLFLVSKVYPWNAGRRGLLSSLQGSLRRMGTDYLDLYLLHWAGSIPLEETIACMEEARSRGLIRAWGVSNLDRAQMEALFSLPGGRACAVDQVCYHLGSRGAEYDLHPYLRETGTAMMSYCPLAQAGSLRQGLTGDPAVHAVAQKHGLTPLQVLLAFVLSRKDVCAIPKSGNPDHVLANLEAGRVLLDLDDLALLDRAFPPPDRPVPLDKV